MNQTCPGCKMEVEFLSKTAEDAPKKPRFRCIAEVKRLCLQNSVASQKQKCPGCNLLCIAEVNRLIGTFGPYPFVNVDINTITEGIGSDGEQHYWAWAYQDKNDGSYVEGWVRMDLLIFIGL